MNKLNKFKILSIVLFSIFKVELVKANQPIYSDKFTFIDANWVPPRSSEGEVPLNAFIREANNRLVINRALNFGIKVPTTKKEQKNPDNPFNREFGPFILSEKNDLSQLADPGAASVLNLHKATHIESRGDVIVPLPHITQHTSQDEAEKIKALYSTLSGHIVYLSGSIYDPYGSKRPELYGANGNLSQPFAEPIHAFGESTAANFLSIKRPGEYVYPNSYEQLPLIFDALDNSPDSLIELQSKYPANNWINILLGFKSIRNFVASTIVTRARSSVEYNNALVFMLEQIKQNKDFLTTESEYSHPIQVEDSPEVRARKMVIRDLFALQSPLDENMKPAKFIDKVAREFVFQALSNVTANSYDPRSKKGRLDNFKIIQEQHSKIKSCKRLFN